MASLHHLHRFAYVLSVVLLCLTRFPGDLHAQLRPLDPIDLHAFYGDRVRVQIGGGVFFDQHASLAGTRGRLLEVGDARFSWRSGRVVVEVAGIVQRFFTEESRVQAPAPDVDASTGDGKRHDAGDYRVQTILRLTGDATRTITLLRFGTRLPTTNNRVGLERDQTDFFASLAAARTISSFRLGAEAGVSINGTRVAHYEQSDVLIYAASLERPGTLFSPFVSVVGQEDFHEEAPRGNEDLGEVRAGVRIGQRRWINATFLRGFRDSSPSAGFTVSAGMGFR